MTALCLRNGTCDRQLSDHPRRVASRRPSRPRPFCPPFLRGARALVLRDDAGNGAVLRIDQEHPAVPTSPWSTALQLSASTRNQT
jgi:hypothetical protein